MAIEFGYRFQFNARKCHQCKHHERNVRCLIDSNYLLLWTEVILFSVKRAKSCFLFISFLSFLSFDFPSHLCLRQHVSMENVAMHSFNRFDFILYQFLALFKVNSIRFYLKEKQTHIESNKNVTNKHAESLSTVDLCHADWFIGVSAEWKHR